jgi:hypothetical protein
VQRCCSSNTVRGESRSSRDGDGEGEGGRSAGAPVLDIDAAALMLLTVNELAGAQDQGQPVYKSWRYALRPSASPDELVTGDSDVTVRTLKLVSKNSPAQAPTPQKGLEFGRDTESWMSPAVSFARLRANVKSNVALHSRACPS